MTKVRWAAERLREHAIGPTEAPPPNEHVDRVLYGLARPVIGARVIVRDLELLKGALFPAAILACVCLWGCWISPGQHGRIRRFYELFACLAPMPSIIMAAHYARLAAQVRQKLGFGPAEPCIEPLWRGLKRVASRAVLIFLAVAPVGLLNGVPIVGHIIWKAVWALWALHWIVVDAFDSARVLRPGQTLKDVDAQIEQMPRPWFVRLMRSDKIPLGKAPLRWLANICDRLARPWRDELAMIEAHPSLMIGFALSTALLIATPVLNLLFRPIVLVAAASVLGRLGEAGAGDELVPVVTKYLEPPAA